MSNALRKIDVVILTLIAVIASAVSIVHFFHLIDAQWFTENLSVFTLLLLGLIGLHLIVAHFAEEDHYKATAQLLQSLVGRTATLGCRTYTDAAEMESFLGKRMLDSRKSICDVTWKTKISEGFAASNRQVAHQYMDKCIAAASEHISYREIFIFNDARRVDKLERRIAEAKDGYSCRYFKEDAPIPRLQFVIVDEEEVFFFASSPDSPLVSFGSRELCRVAQSYFDSVWASARPIKDGPKIYEKELAYIRKLRTSFDP